MRGAEERGRIHLLPVGEAPAGAGEEMGLARERRREMGGSQGRQRGVAVQIQILRRQVPVQSCRREQPADHGRSDPEKGGHLCTSQEKVDTSGTPFSHTPYLFCTMAGSLGLQYLSLYWAGVR